MITNLPALALALGNFVVGLSVLAPAAMLGDLSDGFGTSIAVTGLLLTYGAVVLCVGSPVVSGLTSGLDRRTLMAGAALVVGIGSLASAIAPNYTTLMIIRLLMLVAAAPFTPQAAGTIALIVPPERRSSAIAFVFLGWSLSIAFGLPLVVFLADHFGWQVSYEVLGVGSLAAAIFLYTTLPANLRGTPVSMHSWGEIFRNRAILLLLAATLLGIAGQFATFTYLGPLLARVAGASKNSVSLIFFLFGFGAIIGNVIVTRIVVALGTFRTSLMFLAFVLLGVCLWSVTAGFLPTMAIGAGIWGFGFAAFNSMQQARLVGAAPALAAGSVSLNTSAIYVGQAVGSGAGSILFDHEYFYTIGYVAIVFLVLSLVVVMLTRPTGGAVAPKPS